MEHLCDHPNEDTPQLGHPDRPVGYLDQTVGLEGNERFEFRPEVGIEVDAELATDRILTDNSVREEALNQGTADAIILCAHPPAEDRQPPVRNASEYADISRWF